MAKNKKALDNVRVNEKLMAKSMKEISIKEKLNGLFYLKPDYDAELEMLKFQYDQEEDERSGLHASAIISGGKSFCYREQVLSLFYKMDQGGQNPIHLARIYEEGKSIGTKWQRLFIRAGIGVKEDMDVSRFVKEYDLQYTPDGIIMLDGLKYVVEIKSMNTNQFQTTKNHPSGEKQLKLYMYFEDIPRGIVIVEDKNTQDFKIIYVTGPDFDDIADVIERLENVQKYKRNFIKKKKMVKRLESCTSYECPRARRCPMRDACWGVKREKLK